MNRILSVLISSVIVSLPSGGAAAQKADSVRSTALQSLHDRAWAIHQVHDRWSIGGEASRYIFLNMPTFYRHAVIDRAGDVRALPVAARDDVASFVTRTPLGDKPLRDYVNDSGSAVNGLLVVHRGEAVFEDYPQMEPDDKHIWFSVSKVLVSAAVAVLEQRGVIDVTRAIEEYLPKLADSEWAGVRVIDILDMSSGIDCPFAIGDMDSCFERLYVAYGSMIRYDEDQSLADPIDYIARIPSRRPAGEAFEYQDVNPLLLTILVERLSGQAFDEFVEDEIWQRMGAASDGLLMVAANGRAATPLGVSSTLRDMARFGMLFTPSGRDAASVIAAETVERIQTGGRPEIFERGSVPDMFGGESGLRNTYLWDHVTTDGDLYKDGHAGQGLYVSPDRDLVIAFFGSWAEGQFRDYTAAVERQLATSGLFDD